MPKLIDYPRTSYTGAWEVAEVVDDTGGKCALETCARKLNRKVSGSFKAIVGSAVKFGLLTSKREMLATTTLFRRIKHAYDKQEELIFHREAFLTPPLFTQLCRKFRSRELPVAMLDVLLMREFSVEEINAQAVAKAFIDGARMVNLLDENNVIADIDLLTAQQPPRRELASPLPPSNVFRQQPQPTIPASDDNDNDTLKDTVLDDKSDDTSDESTSNSVSVRLTTPTPSRNSETILPLPPRRLAPAATNDAIATLFGLSAAQKQPATGSTQPAPSLQQAVTNSQLVPLPKPPEIAALASTVTPTSMLFRIQLTGPGINTELDVAEVEDLALIRALLDKIERQLKR